jgi:hypothetical protein
MQSVRIEIMGMESGTHLENCFSWAGDIRPHVGRNYAVLRVSVAETGHCRNELFAAAKSRKSLICECRSTALLPQGKRRRPISVTMRRMAMRSDMAEGRQFAFGCVKSAQRRFQSEIWPNGRLWTVREQVLRLSRRAIVTERRVASAAADSSRL